MIETIVALTIIIAGLGGAVTLVTYSLRSSETTMHRLIAQNLAAEGLEVATNIRDSNYLAGDDFDLGLNGGADDTAIAVFDEATNVWSLDFDVSALSETGAILFQQGGVYRQASSAVSGAPSPYRRLLTIDTGTADRLNITSTVQWLERGNIKQIALERSLFNWR